MIRFFVALCAGMLCVTSRAHAFGAFFAASGSNVHSRETRVAISPGDDGTITLAVSARIESEGDFAWVIPVPSDTTVELGDGLVIEAALQTVQLEQTEYGRAEGCGDGACQIEAHSGPHGDPTQWEPAPALHLVSPYERTSITVDPIDPDLATTIAQWLASRAYAASREAADALATYVREGSQLLVLRFAAARGAKTRTLLLGYAADRASIPVRAMSFGSAPGHAVDVLAFAAARMVPIDFREVEPIGAAFTFPFRSAPMLADAYDGAGGRAFFTVSAGPDARWSVVETLEDELERLRLNRSSGFSHWRSRYPWLSASDGLVDALDGNVTLRPGDTLDALVQCLSSVCTAYSDSALPEAFVDALEQHVLEPARRTEDALKRNPYVTRLVTSLDPSEMLSDPGFVVSPGLEDVSRQHESFVVTHCGRETRTYEVTPEDARVSIDPDRLVDFPNPVRVIAYDTLGAATVVVDEAVALRAAYSVAAYRPPQDCAARASGGRSREVFLSVLFGGIASILAWRRGRRG